MNGYECIMFILQMENISARTHARTHARTDAQTHGRTDTRTHGRTHARTHARTHVPPHLPDKRKVWGDITYSKLECEYHRCANVGVRVCVCLCVCGCSQLCVLEWSHQIKENRAFECSWCLKGSVFSRPFLNSGHIFPPSLERMVRPNTLSSREAAIRSLGMAPIKQCLTLKQSLLEITH